MAGLITRLWPGRSSSDDSGGSSSSRWVVIDCETTGLDPQKDSLLAIAGVALVQERVLVRDSIELTLRPPQVSEPDNILVHGIGQAAQRQGLAPAQACEQFLRWVAQSPLVAFRAGFDRAFLSRAMSDQLGRRLSNEWIGLAQLAPALNRHQRADTLDQWLSLYEIEIENRHQAIDDALASAMLFQRLLGQLPNRERQVSAIQRRCRQARWLG